MNEGLALFSRIQENLADLAPRLIFSDWLEEQNRLEEALFWRGTKPTELDLYELYGDGDGDGAMSGYYYYLYGNFGNGNLEGYGNKHRYQLHDGIGDGHDGFGDGRTAGHDGYSGGFGHGRIYGFDLNSGIEQIQKRDVWLKEHEDLINKI